MSHTAAPGAAETAASWNTRHSAGCTTGLQLPLYVSEQQQEPVQAGVVPVDPDEVHLPQLAQRLTAHMSGM